MNGMLGSDIINILNFRVEKVLFCIDLNSIKKVFQLIGMQLVPGSPNYLAGMINIAGDNIPAIDLGLYLGIKRSTPYTLNTPILRCDSNNNAIALIVDEILGLEKIKKSSLQMQDEFNNATSIFLATVILRNKTFLLVDINKLINRYQLQADS